MPYKVTWKKGMRLTSDVFNKMEESRREMDQLLAQLVSAGRYGLFPASRPFELSVNVSNNQVEVISITCHGVTRNGYMVDIDFDSRFQHTVASNLTMPENCEDDSFLIVLRVQKGEWREVDELISEQIYSFGIVGENSIIDDDTLPIGRLVNQYGWRLDETDFVPPCLYVSAHYRYIELLERSLRLAKSISEQCLNMEECIAKSLVGNIWTSSTGFFNRLDKERNLLTPEELYSSIQDLISSFLIGCRMDEFINLENPEPYIEYLRLTLDYRRIYNDIENGLGLLMEIVTKIEEISKMTVPKPPVSEPVMHKPEKRREPVAPEPVKKRRGWEGLEI